MRCPWCADLDDKVVDSRTAEDGTAIRRRRECLGCGRRFTTFERLEELPMVVVKRSGAREPFVRGKLVAGLRAAAKNRPVSAAQLDGVAYAIEDALRAEGGEITTERIGQRALASLRALDEVAYLRFASVYKGFEAAGDFQREAGLLADPPEAPSTGSDP